MTLHDLQARWFEFHKDDWTDSTRAVYRVRLESLRSYFRKKKLPIRNVGAWTPEMIAGWMRAEREKGMLNVSKLGMIATAMTTWGIDQGILEMKRPIRANLLPKMPYVKKAKYPFTEEQYRRLLRVMQKDIAKMDAQEDEFHYIRVGADTKGNYCAYWPLICAIAWHTGLRFSDICLLKWENIHFDDEVIRVTPIKTRSHSQHLEIPIEPELYKLLLKRRNARLDPTEPYVQPRAAAAYISFRKRMVERFKIFCRKAGLPGHSFHSFRHGFITRLLNAGVDPITIGSITGQCIETIARYSHVSMDAKKVALSKARDALHQAKLAQAGMLEDVEPEPEETLALPEPPPQLAPPPERPKLSDCERDILLNL